MRVAPPLLLALLVTACGAQTLAPETSASSAWVQSAPSVATPVLPPAVQGEWQPRSKALEGPGTLTLTAQTLLWEPCGAVPRAVRGEVNGAATLLTLPGQTACRLNGDPVTHLRIEPRSGNACEIALSVYESAAQLARGERLAWGVYQRRGCAPR